MSTELVKDTQEKDLKRRVLARILSIEELGPVVGAATSTDDIQTTRVYMSGTDPDGYRILDPDTCEGCQDY